MTARHTWRALLALLLTAFTIAACGGDDDEEAPATEGEQPAAEVEQFEPGTTLGDIQEKGEIVIGVKYDVPPFGFKNPQTNEVEGFDVDLGRAVAEALGVEPKFIEAISDNRIPFLEKGTADLILSTMTINEERVVEIDFSEPYFIAEGRILTPKSDSSIQGVEDLDGKDVCTVLGSTYEATLKEQAPDASLKLVDTYSECLLLLQQESVDAISTDDVILTGMIIQDDSLQLVGDKLTTEPYGAGIAKGDTQMKEFVDGVFREFKSDGRWAETYDRWIGQFTGEESEPPDISVEEAVELVAQNPS